MTTPPVPQKPTGPILELPAGVEPEYVNLARIAHSPSDIVIDFAHLLPGEPRAKIRSRVVMTPLSAKLLWIYVLAAFLLLFGLLTIKKGGSV